jgi:hypothetical protein
MGALAGTNLTFGLGEARSATSAGGVQTVLGLASLTTLPASNVTAVAATVGGALDLDFGVTNRGVYVGTASNVGTTGTRTPSDQTNATFTVALTNLTAATRYYYVAYAENDLGPSFGVETNFWTLPNVPGQPSLDVAGLTTISVSLDAGDNPAGVELAVRVNGSEYVQTNGFLGTGVVWQTAAAWGDPVVVAGLANETSYTIDVQARNGNGDVSGFGTSLEASTQAKTAQTITFGPLAPVWISSGSTTLTASADSGLPVSFASSNPGVATVSSNVVTLVGLGSTVITASQSGSDAFLAASDVEQTLVVFALPPEVVTLAASDVTEQQQWGGRCWWWHGGICRGGQRVVGRYALLLCGVCGECDGNGVWSDVELRDPGGGAGCGVGDE